MNAMFEKLFNPDFVALTGKQKLKLAGWQDDEDKQIVPVFPPSYARGKGEEKGSDYVINRIPNGTPDGIQCCDLDSPQSQANRMEPRFAQEPLSEFVPQHKVKLPEGEKSLFEIGHRVADAAVRFSTGAPFSKLDQAMNALSDGNALPLTRLAPTSLIFGFWDSRGSSNIKRPRLLSASIRARDVVKLSRGAQYFPASRYEDLSSLGKKRAKLGLDEVPNRGLGGLLVRGGIYRHLQVNLVALRELRGQLEKKDGQTDQDGSMYLQKYLLGLILLLLREDEQSGTYNLRQGCLLVGPNPDWRILKRDGSLEAFTLPTDSEIKTLIRSARQNLGEAEKTLTFAFSEKLAKEAASKTKDDQTTGIS